MASILKVDALQGVTAAGSILVTGEGNSTTTNLQQGLAKAWLEGSDAAVPQDSFNIASGTDAGTGSYTYALTNDMVSRNYSITVSCHSVCVGLTNNDSQQTSSINVSLFLKSSLGSRSDRPNYAVVMGDLA